jgi:hypothetical protein
LHSTLGTWMMTMVNPSEVTYWTAENNGVMDHHSLVRHLAWVRATTHASNKDIGEPLHITESRVQEVLTNPDTRMRYDYRLRATRAAIQRYPDGVPMLTAFEAKANTPRDALEVAFGRSSEPASVQRTVPKPPPVVVTLDQLALGKPGVIHGDEDFNPEAYHTADEYRAFIYRLEARLENAEAKLLMYQRGTAPMQEKINSLKETLTGISQSNADKETALERARDTINNLTSELWEAQQALDERTENEANLAAFKESLRMILSD